MDSWRRLVLALAATLLAAGLLTWPSWPAGPGKVKAADAEGTWKQVEPKGSAYTLFTPSSGALLADVSGDLLRSDDGGESWTRVNLPPFRLPPGVKRRIAVDPTDHTVVYAIGTEGLYKSIDDAATWTLVRPTDEFTLDLVVSPADPNVLYMSTDGRPPAERTVYRLLRSRDAGATWDEVDKVNSDCQVNTIGPQPHPTEPGRIFRQRQCSAGRKHNWELAESRDFGSTWTTLLGRDAHLAQHVAVASGATPHLYARLAKASGNGEFLMRSDDDGATWAEATPPWAGLTLPPNTQMVGIASMAPDPAVPDRLYVGLFAFLRAGTPVDPAFRTDFVVVSDDAGQTWSDLEFPVEASIIDVKLGIDRKNLFLGTDKGIWRLSLATGD